MASTGKMYEGPLAALTADYPSTLTIRMCEAVSLGADALASFLPGEASVDDNEGIAVAIERQGKALRYGAVLVGTVEALLREAEASGGTRGAMTTEVVKGILNSALDSTAEQDQTAPGYLVESLRYLSAALRAAFEDDVWDSDFQGPLLHAVANAAAAFGLLKGHAHDVA